MHDFADFRSAKFHEICTQDMDLRGGESFWKNIFENLPVRRLFSKKVNLGRPSSTTSDFRPRYLRNDYKSRKVMTGWPAHGMLAFHLYPSNQLIPLACRLRTRSVLSNATSCLIYILKKFNSRTVKKSKDYLTAEQD